MIINSVEEFSSAIIEATEILLKVVEEAGLSTYLDAYIEKVQMLKLTF
jgi:hypothetical protein